MKISCDNCAHFNTPWEDAPCRECSDATNPIVHMMFTPEGYLGTWDEESDENFMR